ncbi:hypothetical protein PATSB16_18760 [Pandoraea thiooxydans]|nr:hypothetical protein PATSB16_18760 [Pandoraea thiooxydans]
MLTICQTFLKKNEQYISNSLSMCPGEQTSPCFGSMMNKLIE